ncbi:MAG: thioredoxin domain-containing protein [Phycisphaerales bacterium]|nr:thioredoxin domain-containing protein [Phycisphaerales bacterium]
MTTSAAKPNRLIHATSPYLRQHAHNPVDWHIWNSEALAEARQHNKPIFLSIGYAACHWCHVMAHESFEDPQVAALLNESFINIKVDREERPDLDELYMLATQLVTGSGGWPMSVWLTPDLEPFYAGTYFPPMDGYGRPSFTRVIRALADAWQNQRTEVLQQAGKIAAACRAHAAQQGEQAGPLDAAACLTHMIDRCVETFDDAQGGRRGAPKFPPSQLLNLWLDILPGERSPSASAAVGDGGGIKLPDEKIALARQMLVKTLDGMMMGGIFDQLAGGFARYSTDEAWLVPHFEKMLYDNAQLGLAYARAAVQLQRPDYAAVARRTFDFWLDEMTAGEGGFYSSLDADSEGHEGRFYVWSMDELRRSLPDKGDAQLAADAFGITEPGNWEGTNVLTMRRSMAQLAAGRGVAVAVIERRLEGIIKTLRQVRSARPRPGTDAKVLTGWNALMIYSLAVAGKLLDEPRYLQAARRAADYILRHHRSDSSGLLRVSCSGHVADIPAFLEDYAFFIVALAALGQGEESVTGAAPSTPRYLAAATDLADRMIRNFADAEQGGFYLSSSEHDALFARIKTGADNAVPSANAWAIWGLVMLQRQTGNEQYLAAAQAALAAFASLIAQRPEHFASMLSVVVSLESASARALQSADAVFEAWTSEPLASAAGGTTLQCLAGLKLPPQFYAADSGRIAFAAWVNGDSARPLEVRAELAGLPSAAPSSPDDQMLGYAGDLTWRLGITVPPGGFLAGDAIEIMMTAAICTTGVCLPERSFSSRLRTGGERSVAPPKCKAKNAS